LFSSLLLLSSVPAWDGLLSGGIHKKHDAIEAGITCSSSAKIVAKKGQIASVKAGQASAGEEILGSALEMPARGELFRDVLPVSELGGAAGIAVPSNTGSNAMGERGKQDGK
jgi:hypothetical protein